MAGTKLDRMIAARDAKRQKLEHLFQQQQAIQQQMRDIESELMALDDQIDALHEEDSDQKNIKVEPGSSLTMADEHFPDPQTQKPREEFDSLTFVEDNYLTDPAATQIQEDSDTLQPMTMKSAISLPHSLGPLHLTSVANIKPTAHDECKAPLQRASSIPRPGTLDEYFITPSAKRRSAGSVNYPPVVDSEKINGPEHNQGFENLTDIHPLSSENFPWSQEVNHLLRTTFRIERFRDHQKEIINSTLQGEDVFVIMRTGGGKSLTYQLPALLEGRHENKVTLVISPLLSLIRDQEDQMNEFAPGSALSFTSGMPGGVSEQARRWQRVRDPHGGVCLVFVTPEGVHKSGKLKSELQKLHGQGRLGRFVIDECHCACQWGKACLEIKPICSRFSSLNLSIFLLLLLPPNLLGNRTRLSTR